MQENRQHPRRSIELPAAFQFEGGDRVPASLRDVSLGGVFLETEAPAPYGARIVIHVKLPGLKDESTIQATVRWVKKGSGMGVQFGVMGARETHALLSLLSG
ncbi:MAG: PilZ domain-containing protein [Polyangiaceae bacterium]